MFDKDKKLHLTAGFVIALIVGFIAYYVGAEYPQSWGVNAGVSAGAGKELYDEWKHRRGEHPVGFDFWDLFATMIGAFFGGLAVVILT